MTDRKEKSIRVLCYVPVDVKKTVQEHRAADPRPSPPSENACYLEMLRRGLAEMNSVNGLPSGAIFRIAKDKRDYFVPVGIRMPSDLHRELKWAAKNMVFDVCPKYAEPVNYRFIDLVACLLSRAVSEFQIKNI